MKVLVFSHRLDVGGAQINAIELTAALRDLHGFEVVLFAAPGPLLEMVHDMRLPYRPAPPTGLRPSFALMRALSDVVRREQPDVLHVWDWWQCLMSYYAVNLVTRTPLVVTDMGSDDVPRLLPKSLPTTFGTPEFVDRAWQSGRRRSTLLLPPVDVSRNAPGAVDAARFREQHGLRPDEIAIVTVSRLEQAMKGDSLRRTIAAVRTLGGDLPLRLFIVGDGDARPDLVRLAAEANAHVGRPVVTVTGELIDPRVAYAAADIVVGMGGSALRGMAFAKPVIVVGLAGFSALFSPDSAERFFYKGIYGKGNGDPHNAALIADIRMLAEHPEERLALGEYSRQFVCKHFSIERVSAHLAAFCRRAATDLPSRRVAAFDAVRTASIIMGRPLLPDRLRRLMTL